MSETGIPPRIPSSSGRSARNPFAQRDRNNFPGVDLALTTGDAPQLVLYNETTTDHSFCSQGTGSSSVLNISIGARAALNEHMRHVAKYGIDGERRPEKNPNLHQNLPTQKSTLDEEWDNLLDTTCTSNVSQANSFTRVSSHPRIDFLNSSSNKDGNETMDAMTDVSNDFFNSSKILLLMTPERNKERIEMVMTRGQEDSPYEEEESDIFGSSVHMAPELKASLVEGISRQSQQQSTDQNSSFISFSAADLSRISATDDSPRQSPNSSFQNHRQIIEDSPFFPAMDMVTPSKCQNSTFESTPQSSPPSREREATPKLPPMVSTPKKSTFRRRIQLDEHGEKENREANLDLDSPTMSPIAVKYTNSPIIASSKMWVQQNGYSQVGALDSMPTDFLRAIEVTQVPSPNLSMVDMDQTSCDGTNNICGFSPIPKRQKGEYSSSSSNDDDDSSSFAFSDRRRYRTVVPSRVFMTGSPSQYPEAQDSFSVTSRNNSHGQHDQTTPKSLIDSFEAAV
jgi:hypothetical protein